MYIDNRIGNNLNSINSTKSSIYNNIESDSKIFDELLKQLDEVNSKKNDDDKNNSSTPFTFKSGNVYDGQTTDKGTKIVHPGQDMDKNAFLRILAAQMSNQDPSSPQDGTEYISQFAQFASMEQMSNLNSTMTKFASQALIGRGVMLNAYDKTGNVITGVIRSVAQNGSNISLGVEYLNELGELVIGEFENDDILNVVDVLDNRLDYINNNVSMLVGSSMIGKNVEFVIENDSDESDVEHEILKGRVEGVIVENNEINVKIRVGETGGIEIVKLDKVIKVKE